MAYVHLGAGALDYLPCRYGESKLLFRGPKRRLDKPYVAVIGGTETYGKFVEQPYPELLELLIRRPTVNLGSMNAGIDVFWLDPSVTDICAGAEHVVIQIMGAQNISNRFYAVHPRRNDRFLKATDLLRTIYRDVDFTEFHFTRHLLGALKRKSAERFEMVRDELKSAWVDRMKCFLEKINVPTTLLWMADHASADSVNDPAGRDPLFVDAEMLKALQPYSSGLVEVVATRDEISAGHERMICTPLEQPALSEMLGTVVHESAAKALAHSMR